MFHKNLHQPYLCEVNLTETQHLLHARPFMTQCVLLPHEIMSSLWQYPDVFYPLMIGEPGRIDKYWKENPDLWKTLGMQDVDTCHYNNIFQLIFSCEITCAPQECIPDHPCLFNKYTTLKSIAVNMRTDLFAHLSGCMEMGLMQPSILRSSQCFLSCLAAVQPWTTVFCWQSGIPPKLHLNLATKFWKLWRGLLKLFETRLSCNFLFYVCGFLFNVHFKQQKD